MKQDALCQYGDIFVYPSGITMFNPHQSLSKPDNFSYTNSTLFPPFNSLDSAPPILSPENKTIHIKTTIKGLHFKPYHNKVNNKLKRLNYNIDVCFLLSDTNPIGVREANTSICSRRKGIL